MGAAWGQEAGIHVGDGETGWGAGEEEMLDQACLRVTGGEVTGCGGKGE